MSITKYSIVIGLCVSSMLYADDNDQQQITDFINTAKSSGEGFAQSWGAPLGGEYKISYEVHNDTPRQIFSASRPISSFQGANIVEDINKYVMLPAYQASGQTFYNMQLLCGMVVDYDPSMNNDPSKYVDKINQATRLSQPNAAQFTRNELNQGDPTQQGYHDPYIIRAYMRHDYLNIEFLSQIPTSSIFMGVFYNNTDSPVQLTFSKDSRQYTVTLDPHSCNNLQSSDQPNSIRPPLPPSTEKRNFIFSGGGVNAAINIPALGFIGAPYTYEIFKGIVDIQGLSVGNYDMIPDDGHGNKLPNRIRDINPVPCSLWVKNRTTEQSKSDSSTDATKLIPEKYMPWIVYKTSDQSITKKLVRGKSNDIAIVRPQLSEGEAWMYVLLPLTTDDTKAQAFLKRVADGKVQVPKQSLSLNSSSFSTLEVNTQGLIDDTGAGGSGIRAYALLADVFLPLGFGSQPLYYTFEPGTVGADQLAGLLLSYIDTTNIKDAKNADAATLIKSLTPKVIAWINDYNKNKSNTGLQKYLLENGISTLFTNPQDRGTKRQFNDYGQQVLTNLTTGQVSLENYPVLRSAGSSNFITPPDGFDHIEHVQL